MPADCRKFPDKRVYLTGEIIHNPHVNDKLRASDIRFLDDPGESPEALGPDDVVILPAFGVTITELAAFDRRGCTLVDTTCGSVLNVWKAVRRYAEDGFTSIIHGKIRHEETRATASQALKAPSGPYLVVLDRDEAADVCRYIRDGGDREAFLAMLRDPSPILGASLRIVAPTGEYDDERIINIGTNRWSTRLQFGYIHPFGNRWGLELSAGAWLYGTNDDFVGMTRTQDPIFAGEAHLIRIMRSGTWLSLDGNYYAGGRSYLDDEPRADFQRNSRVGLSASWPFRQRHIIKASFSTGIATESGGDYEIYSLTYSYAMKPPGERGQTP